MGKKKKDKNGDIPWWLVLGIIFAGGFILTKILTEQEKQRILRERRYKCPNCDGIIEYRISQCPHCGAYLEWARKYE